MPEKVLFLDGYYVGIFSQARNPCTAHLRRNRKGVKHVSFHDTERGSRGGDEIHEFYEMCPLLGVMCPQYYFGSGRRRMKQYAGATCCTAVGRCLSLFLVGPRCANDCPASVAIDVLRARGKHKQGYRRLSSSQPSDYDLGVLSSLDVERPKRFSRKQMWSYPATKGNTF